MSSQDEYRYHAATPSHTEAYLTTPILEIVQREMARRPLRRVFELGCGNGAFASRIVALGLDVTAIDVSRSGIAQARRAYPMAVFDVASAYDDLAVTYGTFDLVLSLEVVEHLYFPRQWAANLRSLLALGSVAIVSTPYHGYLKNLALAICGHFDSHLDPLWDHGHIKFWSVATLSQLLEEAGLRVETVLRVGRIAALAKSMIVVARRVS